MKYRSLWSMDHHEVWMFLKWHAPEVWILLTYRSSLRTAYLLSPQNVDMYVQEQQKCHKCAHGVAVVHTHGIASTSRPQLNAPGCFGNHQSALYLLVWYFCLSPDSWMTYKWTTSFGHFLSRQQWLLTHKISPLCVIVGFFGSRKAPSSYASKHR